ncbi:MAG: ABC transporter substrate-binding protein [Actinomycetota bacterium]
MTITRSRRGLAALAALSLFVAACGDDEETSTASDSASASASESESASASASASASDMADEETSDSASASDMADEEASDSASASEMAETVVVADVLGDVEVPVTSEGVYALDEFSGVALLTLGVSPVQVDAFFQDPLLGTVIESEGVTLEGAGSIESIAAAQPQLIVGVGHPVHLESREQQLGIAPVATPDFTVSWAEQTAVFGAATGTSDRADALVAVVEGRIADLAARIEAEGLAGSRISIIQPFGPAFYAYGPTTLVGDISAQLGFTRSEIQSGAGDFGFIEVSEELLGSETDAAVVVDIDSGEQDGSSIFDSPVVDTTNATATGEASYAWSGNHALAAWVILDDMESIIFGDGSTTQVDDILAAWQALLAAVDAA